ncbi:hypothetical protein BDW59DRAFT_110350 [Aspergillus cavernicola]|uniref:Ras guanyl-nucleotide exchange factor RasGEF n=1 Tax=Aspergillus cavernicola TaxID=176166 RepID=A0ABR4I0T2_9EURO
MSLPTHAKSTYRAILRELPRRSLASPTPLHNRVREAYRRNLTPHSNTATSSTEMSSPQTTDGEEATQQHRIQEAEQFAQYAKAQRMYAMLVDRYNPGSLMDEEERVRLTARRVGMDLPDMPDLSEYKKGKKSGEGEGEA